MLSGFTETLLCQCHTNR